MFFFGIVLVATSFAVHGAVAVGLYGHAYNVPGDFTPAEYKEIASLFSVFTVEKRHAYAVYGNASAQPPFQTNSIAASIGTGRNIKKLNPAIKVLMYWNSALHWYNINIQKKKEKEKTEGSGNGGGDK